jgi:hypothetical protein
VQSAECRLQTPEPVVAAPEAWWARSRYHTLHRMICMGELVSCGGAVVPDGTGYLAAHATSHWGMQLFPPFAPFPHHSEARQRPRMIRIPPSSSPRLHSRCAEKGPFRPRLALRYQCEKKISLLARVVNCITSSSSPSPLLSLFFLPFLISELGIPVSRPPPSSAHPRHLTYPTST